MRGYQADDGTITPLTGPFYRTGDVAMRDADGYFTYVGRDDDVFKASDYRISPFELESALIEHEAVAEAAVVPAPDALRTAVPKAFVAFTVWKASKEVGCAKAACVSQVLWVCRYSPRGNFNATDPGVLDINVPRPSPGRCPK